MPQEPEGHKKKTIDNALKRRYLFATKTPAINHRERRFRASARRIVFSKKNLGSQQGVGSCACWWCLYG